MATDEAKLRSGSGPVWAVLLAVAGLSLLALALVWANRREPLGEAWAAAQRAGNYTVTGTTTLAWAEQTRHSTLRGRGDASGHLVIGSEDASGLDIAWPDVRTADGQLLEPRAVAALLPLGDPLVLLATAHGAEVADMDDVNGRLCRRVTFLVGGRAYQAWWERHRQFLPFNADAGGMPTFTARGNVWLDPATQLPCRIQVRADMPRTPGEGRGTAEVDWVYRWGEED